MDSLRWILLFIGAAIVAGIWWSGYRRSRDRDETLLQRARRDSADVSQPSGLDTDTTPDFDISSLDVQVPHQVDVDEPAPEQPRGADIDPAEPLAVTEAMAAEAEPEQQPGQHEPVKRGSAAAAPLSSGDSAADVEERLEAVYVVAQRDERIAGSDLQQLFSEHGLVHGDMGIFRQHDDDGRLLFSVANLTESGTFDPTMMDGLSTSGIALYVRLPGPPSAEFAFSRMVQTARALAQSLDARVLDQQQSTLTRQTEQHLRDQMRAFDHQHQLDRP